MLRVIVLVCVFVTVECELPFHRNIGRTQNSGTLLRVLQQSSQQTSLPESKVFYFVPRNIEVHQEENGRNQTIFPITTNPKFVENSMKLISENIKIENEGRQFTGSEQIGVYYIYHPNGILQRVEYATRNDENKMTFLASVKYRNVEPIKGPIYTYDPQTLLFKQI